MKKKTRKKVLRKSSEMGKSQKNQSRESEVKSENSNLNSEQVEEAESSTRGNQAIGKNIEEKIEEVKQNTKTVQIKEEKKEEQKQGKDNKKERISKKASMYRKMNLENLFKIQPKLSVIIKDENRRQEILIDNKYFRKIFKLAGNNFEEEFKSYFDYEISSSTIFNVTLNDDKYASIYNKIIGKKELGIFFPQDLSTEGYLNIKNSAFKKIFNLTGFSEKVIIPYVTTVLLNSESFSWTNEKKYPNLIYEHIQNDCDSLNPNDFKLINEQLFSVFELYKKRKEEEKRKKEEEKRKKEEEKRKKEGKKIIDDLLKKLELKYYLETDYRMIFSCNAIDQIKEDKENTKFNIFNFSEPNSNPKKEEVNISKVMTYKYQPKKEFVIIKNNDGKHLVKKNDLIQNLKNYNPDNNFISINNYEKSKLKINPVSIQIEEPAAKGYEVIKDKPEAILRAKKKSSEKKEDECNNKKDSINNNKNDNDDEKKKLIEKEKENIKKNNINKDNINKDNIKKDIEKQNNIVHGNDKKDDYIKVLPSNIYNTLNKEEEPLLKKEKESKDNKLVNNNEDNLAKNKRDMKKYQGYCMFKVRYVIYSKKNPLHH